MFLFHGEARLGARSQYTRRKALRQSCDVSLIGARQLDEAGEVRHQRIERRDVREPQLDQRVLEDGDTRGVGGFAGGGGVDGFDDLVDVGGDEGI